VWSGATVDDATDVEAAEQMLNKADAAVYRAKAAGRNMAVF
jgi:GGDEF domain-containing protein